MGGTLKRQKRGVRSLISSNLLSLDSLTHLPQAPPTITFWYKTTHVPPWVVLVLYILVQDSYCIEDCFPHPSIIEALAAQQEREFLSSNSLPVGGATFPGATWFYVSDTLWWQLLTLLSPNAQCQIEIHPWNGFGGNSRADYSIKLGSCVASITVTNPFRSLSRKTCKSFIPDLVLQPKAD